MDALPLLFAFIAAATVLTLTPGVDTAIVLQAALLEGRYPAALASAGVALGCLVWGAAVALGLGALLQASEWAYTAVRWAGAAYLIWLGARLLHRPRSELTLDTRPGVQPAAGNAFRRGLLTNLLNPKVGIFYVSFLPQFIPAGAAVAGYTFLLACVHVALSLAWFGLLIAATAPLASLLRQPRAVRWMDRLAGLIFVGFGVRLGVSSAG
jgi:threonine/homoserine/homoserine lactone efflux protein